MFLGIIKQTHWTLRSGLHVYMLQQLKMHMCFNDSCILARSEFCLQRKAISEIYLKHNRALKVEGKYLNFVLYLILTQMQYTQFPFLALDFSLSPHHPCIITPDDTPFTSLLYGFGACLSHLPCESHESRSFGSCHTTSAQNSIQQVGRAQ